MRVMRRPASPELRRTQPAARSHPVRTPQPAGEGGLDRLGTVPRPVSGQRLGFPPHLVRMQAVLLSQRLDLCLEVDPLALPLHASDADRDGGFPSHGLVSSMPTDRSSSVTLASRVASSRSCSSRARLASAARTRVAASVTVGHGRSDVPTAVRPSPTSISSTRQGRPLRRSARRRERQVAGASGEVSRLTPASFAAEATAPVISSASTARRCLAVSVPAVQIVGHPCQALPNERSRRAHRLMCVRRPCASTLTYRNNFTLFLAHGPIHADGSVCRATAYFGSTSGERHRLHMEFANSRVNRWRHGRRAPTQLPPAGWLESVSEAVAGEVEADHRQGRWRGRGRCRCGAS